MATPDYGPALSIVEASIGDLQHALQTGAITSIELVTKYLKRILTYDVQGPCLNSIVVYNPNVFDEAVASDARRAAGQSRGPLEGIPYTLKDSMMYKSMTCANGSPAFEHLVANSDSFVAEQLRSAGAVLIGLTNTPPMMASGMHRGLYGRAESPYNLEYLTAAFSSGSSNGSATSTAASFAAFSLGSETVSSGRSPASNNALVAYTPSRTVVSPRGIWSLYPTCDVVVPHTRTVKDMLTILDVLTAKDRTDEGDFWRQQKYVDVPEVKRPASHLDLLKGADTSLRGKRIAVPKMYIGRVDPNALPTVAAPDMLKLWEQARADLEALGATVIETGFPLATRYDFNQTTGTTNNVLGFKPDWNGKERGELVAYLWDDFLKANGDPKYPDLASANGQKVFPRPADYIPDRWMETKNFMNYPGLVELARNRNGKTIWEVDGIAEALPALEAQRKRNLEDWMDADGIDVVAFPANGDVGKADLESNPQSAEHALQNGVKYSNGNRALRHMGVPTTSVTMGLMESSKMPVNLTFAGKHSQDSDLLQYAYAFEQQSHRRIAPPVTPPLLSDDIPPPVRHQPAGDNVSTPELINITVGRISETRIRVAGKLTPASQPRAGRIEAYVKQPRGDLTQPAVLLNQLTEWWMFEADVELFSPPKPLYGGYGEGVGNAVVLLRAWNEFGTTGKLVIADQSTPVKS